MDHIRRASLGLAFVAVLALLLGAPRRGGAQSCNPSTTCNAHGTCNLDDTCACNSGYVGAGCDACAPNYYNYPTCTFCLASTTCNGNVTCSPTGSCNCNAGFSGTNCDIPPPTTTTTITTTTTTTTLPPPEDTGFIPPDNDARMCASGVTKNAGALAKAIAVCHVKAGDSAFRNRSFDEEACETAAKAKFDAAVAKIAAKAQCPPCVLANAPGLRDQIESFLDQNNGQAYCAGTVPLP